MQPETLKAVVEYAGKVWAVVGPLVGVLIGARLARARDREKWLQENRAQECRELLTSISHAATVILNVDVEYGNSVYDADQAYLGSLKIFNDRIFIARDIAEAKVVEVWAHAVGDVRNGRIEPGVFNDRLSEIQTRIINLVVQTKS